MIEDLNLRELYVTARFFDVAKEAEMLPEDAMEGDINLDQIYEKSKKGNLILSNSSYSDKISLNDNLEKKKSFITSRIRFVEVIVTTLNVSFHSCNSV